MIVTQQLIDKTEKIAVIGLGYVGLPLASPEETRHEYGIELIDLESAGPVDAVVWAVAHEAFNDISLKRLKELCGNGNGNGIVIDVKARFDRNEIKAAGLRYWVL